MADAGGWRADPTRRHELRYWDGNSWTEHVSDRGVQDTDADLTPAAPAAAAPAPPATQAPKKNRSGCLWAAVIVAVLAVGVIGGVRGSQ